MNFIGRESSLKSPASVAYAQVFAPHHGWAIRKAVAAGMYALPTRAQLLKKLNEDGKCLYLVVFSIGMWWCNMSHPLFSVNPIFLVHIATKVVIISFLRMFYFLCNVTY